MKIIALLSCLSFFVASAFAEIGTSADRTPIRTELIQTAGEELRPPQVIPGAPIPSNPAASADAPCQMYFAQIVEKTAGVLPIRLARSLEGWGTVSCAGKTAKVYLTGGGPSIGFQDPISPFTGEAIYSNVQFRFEIPGAFNAERLDGWYHQWPNDNGTWPWRKDFDPGVTLFASRQLNRGPAFNGANWLHLTIIPQTIDERPACVCQYGFSAGFSSLTCTNGFYARTPGRVRLEAPEGCLVQ